jgi:tripartite-type tricarboxylate transporter receptor subunit TctC
MNDLLGGHILFMFDNLSSSLPQHQSGALRVIAVCTPERSPHLPEVPTMSEAGLPGFTSLTWFGLVAPPNTPDDIIRQINENVVDMLKTKEVREKFLALGQNPWASHPKRWHSSWFRSARCGPA